MPTHPAENRLLLQTADALLQGCHSLADQGWPLELLVRCVVAVEELADLAGPPEHAALRAVALDIFAFLVGLEEIAQPNARHAAELQRLADALAALTADGDRGAPCIDLLATLADFPPALAAPLQQAGFALRRHADLAALAAAMRQRAATALLVEAGDVGAVCALLDELARELPACGSTVVFAVGDPRGRLDALLQGAEDFAESLDDSDLAARMLERVGPEIEAPFRVLVIDDDLTSRAWLRLVLKQAGIVVEECAGADAAIAAIATSPPDLLLLDLYMPGMDGLSLTMHLRRQPSLALLPILFVSGEEDERARFRAIEAGADQFLTKPVRPRVLLGEVRSRIRRARRAQQAPATFAPQPRRHGQLRRGDFLAQLTQVLAQPEPGWQVLLALKIDQAPVLAQRLGEAGAFALEQAVAARFSGVLQDDDAHSLLLAFGFGVLARRERAAQVVELAQALCRRVAEQPFQIGAETMRLTLSIGIARPPTGGGRDADAWFAGAYAAMSIAHRLGGDRHDGVLDPTPGDMPAGRALIIREFVKEAAQGDHILGEYQPMLPLRGDQAGLYAQQTKLRDYRAPLAGIPREEYLAIGRAAGALAMIERTSVFNAFEAIRDESGHGRRTRILVPMDLESIDAAQLGWLAAEFRRRGHEASRLIIEVDAGALVARPQLAMTMQQLKDLGATLSVAESSGGLARIESLYTLPADLLRLPCAAIDGVGNEAFARLMAPWRGTGRGIIVDRLPHLDRVPLLWDLGVDFLQGDVLAAAGPRLDYDF